MRLDRAFIVDTRRAVASGPIRLFLAIEVVAALVFAWRRGPDALSSVALVWLALAVLAFLAWWAGRHRSAHPEPDAVPSPALRAAFAILATAGMIAWGMGVAPAAGAVLFGCAIAGWSWSALRSGGWRGTPAILARDPRPFLPLLLLVALPKALLIGPGFLVATLVALPSGIGQQLLYLVGLYAPLEALRLRPAAAAVLAALLFGAVHVPILLPVQDGDLVAAVANATLFQASVGLVACLAFQRHRAPLTIGVAHALAIA